MYVQKATSKGNAATTTSLPWSTSSRLMSPDCNMTLKSHKHW